METPVSFALLAARLAAQAAKIRPLDGARVDVAMIMALFVCALLEMLICVCEALDAHAAAEAARAVAAPASRNVEASSVPALRAGLQAPSSERRAPRLALVPEVPATILKRAAAPSETTERPAPIGPWLAWSRDPSPIRAVLAPPWRRRETGLFHPLTSTSISLLYQNEMRSQPDQIRL